MTRQRYTTRRSVLQWTAIGSSLALGSGTVSARRPSRPRRFTAHLSDDPDVPGHAGDGSSDGRGLVTFRYDPRANELDFLLVVTNVDVDPETGESTTMVHLHGDGRADGDYLAWLYPFDGSFAPAPVEGPTRWLVVRGTIDDDHVAALHDHVPVVDGVEGVEDVVDHLASLEPGEVGGVPNVHTRNVPGGELAGITEERGLCPMERELSVGQGADRR